MEQGNGGSITSYSKARTVGGLSLLGLVCILALFDAASPEYSLDSIVLGLILGTSLLLLGVEAGRKLLR